MTGRAEAARRLVVDRREGEVVVVEEEGGVTFDLPGWMAPPDAREGSVLLVRVSGGGEEIRLEIRVDAAATDAARREAESRLDRLRERDPGGDLEL